MQAEMSSFRVGGLEEDEELIVGTLQVVEITTEAMQAEWWHSTLDKGAANELSSSCIEVFEKGEELR